ncbi:MAG TPA: hypothetical protein VHC00_12855 [Rhizobiaceae bacterium]|nr:hypothetical protein [Rhizobiaceae bacterium]
MQGKTGRRRFLPAFRLALFSAFFLLPLGNSADAHSSAPVGPTSGISIPSLDHGQMAVIARYRHRIVALAGRQIRTDETLRRLLNYANIQFTYCLWGLVPGSVGDEGSPFNECSHAYLAAIHALLVHLQRMDHNGEEIGRLVSDIDADMVRNRTSFVLCRYSGEAFNTASFIAPNAADMFSYPPILAGFGITTIVVAGSLFGSKRLLRRRVTNQS